MKIKLILLVSVTVLACLVTSAKAADLTSSWDPLKFFVGSWEGSSTGESGKGESVRTYEFVLNNKFIQIRNKTHYPAQENNPKGETHEDLGFISFDKIRKVFVLRQFHIESFVNQYKSEALQDTKTLVFVSESIENIPSGWRARETYKLLSDNEFTETFDLAAPNEDFKTYSATTYRRKIN